MLLFQCKSALNRTARDFGTNKVYTATGFNDSLIKKDIMCKAKKISGKTANLPDICKCACRLQGKRIMKGSGIHMMV